MRTKPAAVYMNRGRWVVDCPHEECAWAYRAQTEHGQPRYQLRCEGGLGVRLDSGISTGVPGCGRWIELLWPPLEVALEIERILFKRRQKLTQNWRPPETIETISRENEELLIGWTVETLAEKGIGVV